jgi:predicted DNA-binding ribbon-helix-helix protein
MLLLFDSVGKHWQICRPMSQRTKIHSKLPLDGSANALSLLPREIRIGARRTSFRLDQLTWRLLHDIARREDITVDELCTALNEQKPATCR